MVPDPCISIVVAAAEEVTAAAETARAAKKRQKERKRRTRRANKGVVIVFPAAAIAIAIFLIKSALSHPSSSHHPMQSHLTERKRFKKREREKESRSLARSFVLKSVHQVYIEYRRRSPERFSSGLQQKVHVGVFVKAKKKRVQKTTRPVLKLPEYDTLNYTTPLKRLVRGFHI